MTHSPQLDLLHGIQHHITPTPHVSPLSEMIPRDRCAMNTQPVKAREALLSMVTLHV